jgi:ElaB/YqjD/DUF883 family membrane-anchored ribosome-binding protein
MTIDDRKESSSRESLATSVGEHAKHYVDSSVDAVNAVSGKAREMGARADECVRTNAWIAMGLAAGAGLVLGYLLRSRRS